MKEYEIFQENVLLQLLLISILVLLNLTRIK